jgi:uncharacterized protein YkwD
MHRQARGSCWKLWSVLAALMIAGCVGGVPLPSTTGSPSDGDPAGTDGDALTADTCEAVGPPAATILDDMYEALNTYRLEHGKTALTYSKTLEAAALAQARDLYERDFFDHINPDGATPGDRALLAGYCHPYVGENIAAGFVTVDSVMDAWIASPGHNENMLNDHYEYCGMGYFLSPFGRPYWVQVFALGAI